MEHSLESGSYRLWYAVEPDRQQLRALRVLCKSDAEDLPAKDLARAVGALPDGGDT